MIQFRHKNPFNQHHAEQLWKANKLLPISSTPYANSPQHSDSQQIHPWNVYQSFVIDGSAFWRVQTLHSSFAVFYLLRNRAQFLERTFNGFITEWLSQDAFFMGRPRSYKLKDESDRLVKDLYFLDLQVSLNKDYWLDLGIALMNTRKYWTWWWPNSSGKQALFLSLPPYTVSSAWKTISKWFTIPIAFWIYIKDIFAWYWSIKPESAILAAIWVVNGSTGWIARH